MPDHQCHLWRDNWHNLRTWPLPPVLEQKSVQPIAYFQKASAASGQLTIRPESLRPQMAIRRKPVHFQGLRNRLLEDCDRDDEQNGRETEDRPVLPRDV